MALNKSLLRKIARHILEEPRRYNQRTFGQVVSPTVSPCGARACIAGWADFLANGNMPQDMSCQEAWGVEGRAIAALGINRSEADTLFMGDPTDDEDGNNWPEPYATDYGKAYTPQAKAEVAARYLNRVARTGKVD